MEIHRYTSCLLILICFQANLGDGVPVSAAETQSKTAWWSQPFDHECLKECAGETTKRKSKEDVSILNRNCSVQCKGGSVRHRSFPSKDLKWVTLKNPLNGARSTCLVQILIEDITCGNRVRTGSRKFSFDSRNQCQRRNYKYYLPHQNCDGNPRHEVGEETCRNACVDETIRRGRKVISINVARQRAVFRTCYKGMVTESRGSRRRMENFCRAEMTPCSDCFAWGNWTSLNSCSRTCGTPGTRTSIRGCFIKERTGLYGGGILWTPITTTYCEEYIGGSDRQTSQCGSYTACPGWTQWGPWSECPSEVTTSSHNSPPILDESQPRERCRKRVKRQMDTNFTSDLVQTGSGGGQEISAELQEPTKSIRDKFDTLKLNGRLVTRQVVNSRRTRKCLPIGSEDSLCRGNSSQIRLCRPTSPSTTESEDEFEDCDNGRDGASLATTPKIARELLTIMSTSASYFEENTASATSGHPFITQHGKPGGKKDGDNPSYTLSDDEITNVINAYAPVLIAGLLIFIVLLLVALIAVCGARVMQKSRASRYDVASPSSFSAGTMGSIPSGLVHGFSHVLGLRRGSGTFGRSETAANGVGNFGEIVENRGSCRSIASSAASRGRTKQPPSSYLFSSNSIRAGSPHQRIPLTELGKKSESNMGSKKPSNSSLLSSGSSASGLPPVAPPCPSNFYPLPPLPPQLPPQPAGNDTSVFKRGVKKSSSLNPGETGREAHTFPQTQPRAESVSGRVSSGQKYTKPFLRKSKAKKKYDASSSDSYCHHSCDPETCDVSSDNHEASENEYWSVTRPGGLESDESFPGPLRTSNQNTPKAKQRDKRNIRSLQRDSPMKNIGKRRSRSSQEPETSQSAQTEMIENVLYAQKKSDVAKNTEDWDSLRESTDEAEDQVDFQLEEERVYNTIEMEDADDVSEPEFSLPTEGAYDHLCDQFGGPHSTKGRVKYPGTMTSLHYQRNNDDDDDAENLNTHDYESIDVESKHRRKWQVEGKKGKEKGESCDN